MIRAEAIKAAAKAIHGYDVQEGLASVYAPNNHHQAEAQAALEAALPYMQQGWKIVNTYYRSLTPDGKVWCESRDPHEVRRMSKGKNCTFEKYDIYEVATGWEPWSK